MPLSIPQESKSLTSTSSMQRSTIDASTVDMSKLVLQPNIDRIAAELIEGDAIIINVATGTYYSTQGIGGWIWERCAAGLTVAEIMGLGSASFEVSSDQLESDFLAFAETLRMEDLVLNTVVERVGQSSQKATPTEKKPYTVPTLLIYRDLKDLLALDPPMPRLDLDSRHGG